MMIFFLDKIEINKSNYFFNDNLIFYNNFSNFKKSKNQKSITVKEKK